MAKRTGSRVPDILVPEGFCACPVDIAFNVVGKKWTVLLIRNMLRGTRHFNEFLSQIPGLGPRTLSARLKELEKERLVLKTVARTSPLSVEYRLTEKGHAVLPILEQMVRWSVVWAPDRVFGAKDASRDVERSISAWADLMLGKEDERRPTPGTDTRPPVASRRKLTDSGSIA